MEISNKKTSIDKYTAVSDNFIGPLAKNQVRLGDIDNMKIEYEKIDYSLVPDELNSFATEYIKKSGDINGDGKITVKDKTLISKYLKAGSVSLDYDVNGDGVVDELDLKAIESYLTDDTNLYDYFNINKLLKPYSIKDPGPIKEKIDDITEKINELNRSILSLEYAINNKRGIPNAPANIYEQWESSLNEKKIELKKLESEKKELLKLIEDYEYKVLVSSYDFQIYKNRYKEASIKFNLAEFEACNYDIASYINEKTVGKSKEEIEKMRKNGELNVNGVALVEYIIAQDKGEHSLKDIANNYPNLRKYFDTYMYLSEEERIAYSYLYDTQGEEAADKYMASKQDAINQAIGTELAFEFILSLDMNDKYQLENNLKNMFCTSGQGLKDGILTFYEGLRHILDTDTVLTAEDYKKTMILQILSEHSDLLKGTYEFSSSLGNMLPSMATSAIVSFLATPAAGHIVSSSLMGASAAGKAKHQALASGHNIISATLYGMFSGASEATLGYYLGKIPGISKISGLTLGNLLSEGAEEYLQEWIDAGLQTVILHEDVDWSSVPENAQKSFMMGVLMSGFLNGGQKMVSLTINGKQTIIDIEKAIEAFKNDPSSLLNVFKGNKSNLNKVADDIVNGTVKIEDAVKKYDEGEIKEIAKKIKKPEKLAEIITYLTYKGNNENLAGSILTGLESDDLNNVLKHYNSNNTISIIINEVLDSDDLFKIAGKIKDVNVLENVLFEKMQSSDFDMKKFLNEAITDKQIKLIADNHNNVYLTTKILEKLDSNRLKNVIANIDSKLLEKAIDYYQSDIARVDRALTGENDFDTEFYAKIVAICYSLPGYDNVVQYIKRTGEFKKVIQELSKPNYNFDFDKFVKGMTDDQLAETFLFEKEALLVNLNSVAQMNRICNSITASEFGLILFEKNQLNKKILQVIPNEKLVSYIEAETDINSINEVLKNVSKSQYDYIVKNLEGTLKNELANKLGLDTLKDSRVENLVIYANGKMRNDFYKTFKKYVSIEKLEALEGTNKFYNYIRFYKEYGGKSWFGIMGFNDGIKNVLNLKYSYLKLLSTIPHEAIHQLSRNNGKIGLCDKGANNGLNECVTEYLTELAMGDDYYTKITGLPSSGYDYGVAKLKKIINTGVLNNDIIMDAYFNNKPEMLKEAIDKAGGDGMFERMCKDFDNIIKNNVISELRAASDLNDIATELTIKGGAK